MKLSAVLVFGFAIFSPQISFCRGGENSQGNQELGNNDIDLADAPPPRPSPNLKARAWIPQENGAGFSFPEESILSNRSRTGICFSGGGYRSYIASVAYLRALLHLDLLKDTRHIVGTSGGSWAVAIYSFAPRDGGALAASDAELLGDIVPPENITLDHLRAPIPAACARSAATRRYALLRTHTHRASHCTSF
jgi:hypothetical protein